MFRNFFLFFLVFTLSTLFSQEGTKPLGSNINYIYKNLNPIFVDQKTDVRQHRSSAAGSIILPFVEDFYYSTRTTYPDQNKWEDSLVYVNSGMPTAPPSIGVATFDGLNKHGYPYNPVLSVLNLSYPADTLTSKPINLHVAANGGTLLPTSGVALSFYYQARGKGDNPELNDSLILDFYRPLAKPDTAWKSVWFKLGNSNSNTNDTAFKRAFIPITDSAYLHDGFKFRFRNWASVTGNFDHWHVDYIIIDKGREDTLPFTAIKDITFGDVPTSFLKQYSQMPWQQYDPSEMEDSISVKIRNNSAKIQIADYGYKIYDQSSNLLVSSYNATPYSLFPFEKDTLVPGQSYGYTTYQRHSHPEVKDPFTLNHPMSAGFLIKHFVYLSPTGTDTIPQNDTVYQYQKFKNYYAFDDGSAEAGYYVNSSAAKIAVKIKLNKPDTLFGLRIYFDPVGNVSSISNTATTVYNFSINVWGANLNGTPNDLNNIRKDSVVNHPVYISDGFKEVPEYKLKRPLVLPPGTYYIGIQQASSILTIGFDRNYNHKSSLYFNSSGVWEQSTENGSIMMHPVFGSYLPLVGIDEIATTKNKNFFVYPNPSAEQFTIASSQLQNSSYKIFNSVGQIVKEEKISSLEHNVSVSNLSSGMYILILETKGQPVQQQKIIVQH